MASTVSSNFGVSSRLAPILIAALFRLITTATNGGDMAANCNLPLPWNVANCMSVIGAVSANHAASESDAHCEYEDKLLNVQSKMLKGERVKKARAVLLGQCS